MKTAMMLLLGAGGCLALSSCLVERTVTDESGNVIYRKPEVVEPFQSEEERREEVMATERALGY